MNPLKTDLDTTISIKISTHKYHISLAMRLVLLITLLTCIVSVHAESTRSFDMGFTPWPWDISTNALDTTYDFINKNADIISHHIEEGVPWNEALKEKAFHKNMLESWNVRKKSTGPNLKIFLSISPINQLREGLADYRGSRYQMPIPKSFKGLPFNDPKVKKAYTNYAKRAVKYFKPDYMAIAIEVNELLENKPQQWKAFTELYKHTYKALKKSFPDLPVFFTISLHNIMNKKRANPKESWKKISELWKFSDRAAISFYPFLLHPFDLRHPLKVLDEVKKYTKKPIVISETGYPAKKNYLKALNKLPATPDIQKNIYYALLNKANKNNYNFVILWTYRDYDILWNKMKKNLPEWGAIWRDVGLQDEKGKNRPSKQVWDLFLAMPKR